jgi:thiamine pyrophosphate-dependent acetolactate synthase large subunit-like protein
MSSPKKTTGPRFVAETLRGYGVSHVFFVPQMLLETLTGMEGTGIRRVMTHGEKAVAYMADGYARASIESTSRRLLPESFYPRLSAFICG